MRERKFYNKNALAKGRSFMWHWANRKMCHDVRAGGQKDQKNMLIRSVCQRMPPHSTITYWRVIVTSTGLFKGVI